MGRPGLTKNRKFVRLERLLGSHIQARGALETIWDVCNESGDDRLGDSLDVEGIARWDGEPGKLTAALADAGFIEDDPFNPGNYRVHDFWHHAPEYVPNRKIREEERRKEKVCGHCGKPYHSPDARSLYCSKACKTAAWRDRSQDHVTDGDSGIGHSDRDVTDCDPSPNTQHPTPITQHPSPPTNLKTIPPPPRGSAREVPPVVQEWHSRLRGLWPKTQPDGKAAPGSSRAETEKRFASIVRAGTATPEELAWSGHLYVQQKKRDAHYVVSLETFLGPKRIYEEFLEGARAEIARRTQ